ncbi:unnamed protein product [Meganyctiphanes norvegica]|uniref:Carbohydrate sulfotransferase n=1 Tax=Meganyctiphanes norvegica TaxID=48144 RepID=A0AAV2QUB4_MEGNR
MHQGAKWPLLASMAIFMVVTMWVSNNGQQIIVNSEAIPEENLLSVIVKKPVLVQRSLTPKEITSNWKKTQQHRRRDLKQVCSGLSNSSMTQDYLYHNQKLLSHLLVDHKYRAVYCYIPKVACTNWKKLWLQMKNITYKTSTEAHSKSAYLRMNIRKIKSKEYWYVMKTYKKFMIVRNPIERLVSAYRNKFEHSYNESIFWKMSINIMQHYRKWTDVPINATLVTFKEFVQFLIDSVTQGEDLNEHWKSYEGLCHPCAIQYDYIGRYESLSEDSNQILRELKVPSNLQFPEFRPKNTLTLVQQYLDTLHPQQRKELYRIYKRDYLLFKYQQISAL